MCGYLFVYRAATSSLTDLEMKLNKSIERNVILENEIQAKDNLNENNQRLKDELNGKHTRILGSY
jgi:FtsZ-binding cell division protein ZapB